MYNRPRKRILPKNEQELIIDEAIKIVKDEIIPMVDRVKILLTGGALEYSIGEYVMPLDKTHDRSYSDVDFVVYTHGPFPIKKKWKLIAKRKCWSVYRLDTITGKYPVECLFLDEDSLDNDMINEAERKGIPIKPGSKIPFRVIYDSSLKPSVI